ncbi:endospore germination permease [Salicibibacter cibarius]|uniref:Endospore germination permease n=1 Tax=Salicibibacter cibarius TaxID=2743000 RepID=A0A7T6Z2I6_9BACI|nr:endospore germination permease [Salicibibacter cibarius]QQK75492.1 endospore germination permease [Salicibibacter cibarius]
MLNRWETLFLILTTVPIMGHVQILPLIYDVAGRDSWIAASLSFPVGIGLIIVIYRLRLKYPDLDFRGISQHLLGRFVGKTLLLVIAFYFLFLSAFSAAAVTDMVNISFFPETPVWALVIFFLLFCLYAASKGVKVIAYTALFIGVFALFTGHSISFIDVSEKEFNHILPLLEFGFAPVIWGTIALISVWAELIFLLFLPLQNIRRERFLRFWMIGGLGIFFTMISTMTGTIMVFGMGQTDSFNYPALETVRILTLGFIDRFDIYGLILMTFGCYIRSALFFFLAYDQLVPHKEQHRWVRRGVFLGLGLLTGGLALYIANNHLRIEYFTMLYTNALIFAPIPFLLLAFSWIKRKNHKEMSA